MAPHFASPTATTDTSESSSSNEILERPAPLTALISAKSTAASSGSHRTAPNRVQSMPHVLQATSSSSSYQPPRFNRSHTNAATTTANSSRLSQWQTPAKVLDRSLLRRLDDVTTELARLERLSVQLDAPPRSSISSSSSLSRSASAAAMTTTTLNDAPPALAHVQSELAKLQRSASAVFQSQRQLQERIARHEKPTLRRLLSFNRDQKTERLKRQLCAKTAESLALDAQVEQLARTSESLHSDWRASLWTSTIHDDDDDDATLATQLATLEHEKQRLVCDLLATVAVPDAAQLQARIAMCASESHACASVQRQIDSVASLFERALALVCKALALVGTAATLSSDVLAFAAGPYAFTIEAGQLLDAARTCVQPESRRRYRELAPAAVDVVVPQFPVALVDVARRTRTHVDPHSVLALDALRSLDASEHVIVLTHRLVLAQLDALERWRTAVMRDQLSAGNEQQRLEKVLQQRMAVAARSVSV